ncbi:MAG: DNA-processing protein DprA [Planctomycetota bacterium]|nr:DNA-processing protein DprA [Planctomycetota bacterium]
MEPARYRDSITDPCRIPEPQQLRPGDRCWPAILDTIPFPPRTLYLSGEPVVECASLAIVGSRQASVCGLRLAFEIAAELTRAGFRVVSGLAHGIDAAALEGALHGGGRPLALLGNGLPAIYPVENKQLAARIIAAGGSLVTEYEPGTPPRRGNFPRRNRLISGWSLGVIVVEAARKSGSMSTARYAIDQGREVFAFPGSIDGGGHQGCHDLIRHGAHLVTQGDDILEILAGFGPFDGGSRDGETLARLVTEHGADLSQLLEVTGWSPVRLLKAWSLGRC